MQGQRPVWASSIKGFCAGQRLDGADQYEAMGLDRAVLLNIGRELAGVGD